MQSHSFSFQSELQPARSGLEYWSPRTGVQPFQEGLDGRQDPPPIGRGTLQAVQEGKKTPLSLSVSDFSRVYIYLCIVYARPWEPCWRGSFFPFSLFFFFSFFWKDSCLKFWLSISSFDCYKMARAIKSWGKVLCEGRWVNEGDEWNMFKVTSRFSCVWIDNYIGEFTLFI